MSGNAKPSCSRAARSSAPTREAPCIEPSAPRPPEDAIRLDVITFASRDSGVPMPMHGWLYYTNVTITNVAARDLGPFPLPLCITSRSTRRHGREAAHPQQFVERWIEPMQR